MKNKLQLEGSIADIFDAEFGDYDSNIQFYIDLIEGDKILDLSCGTGRTIIPLSQQGFDCVGLDSSRTLLNHATEKAGMLPITFVLGDMRRFDLHQRFDLILLTGHTFQSFATISEQQRMLRCVRRHLNADGLFVFQMQNLTAALMHDDSNYAFWHTFKDKQGQKIKVFGKRQYDSDDSILTYRIKRSGQMGDSFSEMRLLLTPLDDVVEALQNEGMEVVHLFSDYQRSPHWKEADNIIVVARILLD